MWFEHMGWREALLGLWRPSLAVLWAFLLVLFLAGLMSAPAWPRMHAGPGVMDGGRRLGGGGAAPLDGFTQPAAAYSLRKVLSAYAGPGVKLRRATGGTQDINFLGCTGFTGCPLDGVAAAAFCAATTCFIDTWYDQSGSGRHATQVTAALQPAYISDCGGGLPCAEITTTTQRLDSPAITWASAIQTMSVVGNRTVGTGRCYFAGKTAGYFNASVVANNWNATDFATEFYLAAADNAWHAGIAIFNGASSLGRIDASEIAGVSIAGSSAAAALLIATGEGAGTTCREREAIVWGGYALPLAERAALTANQRSFWGF